MTNIEGNLWRWYHNISECNYHIQLTIKYRKTVLDPQVQSVILETLKGFKERFAVDIHEIGFDGNHIHILCQFLPKYSGGQVIGLIKKLTAKQALKLPQVKQELWGGEFWTDGYYIGTISNRGNRKIIEQYIRNQGKKQEGTQLRMFTL
ncbi:MAG TPA: IS200/IS605 family transposase [Candidatus Peribacteraceae bacterium]|nr:IS200/IS605 family transposase [Candidatus Peribacteraceae bacterium]